MQQSVFGQQPGQQQPGNWAPANRSAAQRVTDCTAVVLDGLWPYELMQQRPETMQLAQYLHQDLQKIVEKTNEELRQLAQLNLADSEYRASEERFIRVARAMAIMRVESTVRQLGGRSILGAQGMPKLTAAPVQQRRAASDPLESTTVVSPEVIAQARLRAQQIAAQQSEAEQTRVVPVVAPPYLGDSPADTEQTSTFPRHRIVEEQGSAVDGPAATAAAPPPLGQPVIIDQDDDIPAEPAVQAGDGGAASPLRSSALSGADSVSRLGISDFEGMTTEPVTPLRTAQGAHDRWTPTGAASAGRHREPVAQPEPADAPRERPTDGGYSQQPFAQGYPAPSPGITVEPLGFEQPGSAPPPGPINGARPAVNGHRPANGHDWSDWPAPVARAQSPVPAPPRPSGPLALEQPVTLEQMVGSLARQQPSLKWLVAQRSDGTTVAVCDALSGWIPPGITLPAGVTVLAPEERAGQMQDWVGPVTRSAKYAPGNRIERRNVSSVAGEEAFAVVAITQDLGERIAEATSRPLVPRIANTLVRAAVSGNGVLPAELDVLNVHVEMAVQALLAEAPYVNADEAVSCMLMGAAAAIAAGRARLAAYHFGWFEAIEGRRGK